MANVQLGLRQACTARASMRGPKEGHTANRLDDRTIQFFPFIGHQKTLLEQNTAKTVTDEEHRDLRSLC